MENKICLDCWYYIPDPETSKILDESEPVTNFPYCQFYNDNPSAKPDDSCENWESKKFKMINTFKSLLGL
jgi:hypothetical protein